MGGEHEVEELVEARQTGTQVDPVIDAGLDEARQLFELLAADGGLRVERFQVIPEMAVNVLVVIAFGQLAELPAEAVVAGVILAAGAPAVATPVPKALDKHLQLHVPHHIHGPTFAHRQMVRRIEGLGGKITEEAGGCG